MKECKTISGLSQHVERKQLQFLWRIPTAAVVSIHGFACSHSRMQPFSAVLASIATMAFTWQHRTEPGGSHTLLLEWLRNAVQPPGSKTASL